MEPEKMQEIEPQEPKSDEEQVLEIIDELEGRIEAIEEHLNQQDDTEKKTQALIEQYNKNMDDIKKTLADILNG